MKLDIAELVQYVKEERNYYQLFDAYTWNKNYSGRVQVKERPRMKGGRAFTPQKTRDFEAKVRRWAKQNWEGKPAVYPMAVRITVYEENAFKADEDVWGFTYNQKGDIDNLGKSILDGLNGVVYRDDKQITELTIQRCWGKQAGFFITTTRSGLTTMEYNNFMRRLKRG